jgi:saccharopine dehydrogenase-like NADP-dependent oxidoreductase
MRVLAVGGAGGMGRHACRIAASLNRIDDLVVTDLDEGRAAAFAATIGPPARAFGLDVTDEKPLLAALREADAVINTAGPFFRFGVPVLRAAIMAGCDYLDICDDWEPTLDMLAMHPGAQAAGVVAVIGMGASPGVSNLLATMAARELDQAHTIVTGWNIEAAQPEDNGGPGVSAALVHGIRQMTGTIRVARDHRQIDEPPLQRTIIDYPGLGERQAWTFGHPEPLTLTHTFQHAGTSVNVTYARPGLIAAMKALRWAVDHGIVSAGRAAAGASWAEHHLHAPAPGKLFHPRRLPPLFGHATGTWQGKPAAAAAALCRPPGTTMGALTGIPLAVALGLLCDKKITSPGVYPPEAIIDPGLFFTALARQCPDHPDPAEMVSVIRSWDTDPNAQYETDILAARRYTQALQGKRRNDLRPGRGTDR